MTYPPFDSEHYGPAKEIGPTIDAALDALGEDFTIALPVNGRTTYMGYHFVNASSCAANRYAT